MAQAVAARTYAIYQMREASSLRFQRGLPPFDLNSTVKDQVYEGAHQERYRTMQAVIQTRGQILTYNGRAIKAFYHSTCGGRTESPEKVWGLKLPYLKSVTCGFCNRSPRFSWLYRISREQIEAKLRKENLLLGELSSMRVLSRNSIGRAEWVEIRGTLGSQRVSAIQVRNLLGTLNLRSTDFQLNDHGPMIEFLGRGSGHAVGMCQWGAKTMGDQGSRYKDILTHYYPAATLTKLY
jgi:stage II sporulation protein D